MLTICVGQNGSGKSLWALHQVEEVLMRDRRPIVTTLAVDVDRLNEYLQAKYKERAPNVTDRIIRIDKESMRKFWRTRGWGPYSEYGRQPIVRGPFGDSSWATPDGGVVYVIDEAQVTFGAREWQQIGPEFKEYQSQHRKMSDDVICISPASSLLDKQMRVLCGECVVLQNFYKLKFGAFKPPRKIVYSLYQNCPPMPGEDPLSKGNIYIEGEKLAGCYNTAAGVGIVGAQADKGKESKGVPWWMVIPAALACAGLLWFGLSKMLSAGTKWGEKKVAGGLGVSAAGGGSAPSSPAPPGGLEGAMQLMPRSGGGGASTVLPREERPGRVVHEKVEEPVGEAYGWARVGDTVSVDTEYGLLYGKKIEERGRYVILDGTRFRRAKKPEIVVVEGSVVKLSSQRKEFGK